VIDGDQWLGYDDAFSMATKMEYAHEWGFLESRVDNDVKGQFAKQEYHCAVTPA
jgi:hypothetical protein